jgi:hypothetical protein
LTSERFILKLLNCDYDKVVAEGFVLEGPKFQPHVRGRTIAQAVSRWLPTAAGWVQTQVWSSGICGGQSGAGAGFLRVLRFPLPIFIPPNSPSPQSPGAGTIGYSVADVPSGPSLDSTVYYAN